MQKKSIPLPNCEMFIEAKVKSTKKVIDDFVLITEDEIYDAIGMALYHTHNLAEGASAASIMAAYRIRDKLRGKNVVLQRSGCNASPEEIMKACSRKAFRKGNPEK